MQRNWILAVACLTCIAGGLFLFDNYGQIRADEDLKPRADKTRTLRDKVAQEQRADEIADRKASLDKQEAILKQLTDEKRRLEEVQQRANGADSKEEKRRFEATINLTKAKLAVLQQQTQDAKTSRGEADHAHDHDAHEHDHAGHDHGGHDEGLAQHIRQLQLHKAELEVQGAEYELTDRMMKFASNQRNVAAWGIQRAVGAMAPKEAIKFLTDLAAKTEDATIAAMIRMRLVELHEATGNVNEVKNELRRIISGK